MTEHESVLLNESVGWLNVRPDGRYVDATYGAGGHSRLIASKLQNGMLYSFDQDADAIPDHAEENRITLVRSNFRFIRNFLKYYKALPVDGILADLGISSHHINTPERGFSFRFDAPLDMRMNIKSDKTAAEIVNTATEEELFRIFKEYGEAENALRLAKAIVISRTGKEIQTTFELAGIAKKFTKPGHENAYLAKVFQALRIEVNQELSALDEFLQQAYDCLRPGGRLVIIAYHSLEDRRVKQFFKRTKDSDLFSSAIMGQRELFWKILTPAAIVPSDEEIERNPRSRSAKLRVALKK